MKKIIEITGLSPRIDMATLQVKDGVIMAFKNETGKFEQVELPISQMDIMSMLGIKNLPEANGRKFEIDIDDKNMLTSILPIDTRVPTYKDFEKLQTTMNEILGIIRKKPSPENSTIA